jgi:thymidine kinase
VIAYPSNGGWIEVICGSMFSGKTEELIRRLRRAAIARQSVQCFKHGADDRYDGSKLVSHDRRQVEAAPLATAQALAEAIKPRTRVVGIDEAQFFGEDLVPLVERLADEGRRVIVAGLDQDFRGQPFGAMPHLMAVAEYVTKAHAICVICGNPANRSQRVRGGDEVVQVGAEDSYEPRCRTHFEPEGVEGRRQWSLPLSDPSDPSDPSAQEAAS